MTADRRCKPGSRLRARGLSLLELLVALAVLSLSLTMLYQVQASLLRGTEEAAAGRRANLLLRSLLNSRDAVPASGWAESGESDGLAWRVQTRALPRAPGLPETAVPIHELTIEINWRSRRGPHSLSLTTLLPQETSREEVRA